MSQILQRVIELAKTHGFEFVATTTADRLQVREEVRAMCAADSCHAYGRNWACPPAIGGLDEFQAKIDSFSDVVVVETVMELEDKFDFETMMEAEQLHKQRLEAFADEVRGIVDECMPLGAGTCTLCQECTYPHAPCRFPERQIVSMEAAGLVVSDVCNAADIAYNHGSDHICYVSCILL
ncbi:MAG: DUF2284 domain-containing protein [Coriobacteriales bacterium]